MVGEPSWSNTCEFPFKGEMVRQLEQFFVVRISETEINLSEEVRRTQQAEAIVAMRWWSVEALEGTAEVVFPEDLSARVRRVREASVV